jgi:hypothetical protein
VYDGEQLLGQGGTAGAAWFDAFWLLHPGGWRDLAADPVAAPAPAFAWPFPVSTVYGIGLS